MRLAAPADERPELLAGCIRRSVLRCTAAGAVKATYGKLLEAPAPEEPAQSLAQQLNTLLLPLRSDLIVSAWQYPQAGHARLIAPCFSPLRAASCSAPGSACMRSAAAARRGQASSAAFSP